MRVFKHVKRDVIQKVDEVIWDVYKDPLNVVNSRADPEHYLSKTIANLLPPPEQSNIIMRNEVII